MNWLDRLLAEDLASLPVDRGPGLDPAMGALLPGSPLEDARDLREERAAIYEYEAGIPRQEAERRAGLGAVVT